MKLVDSAGWIEYFANGPLADQFAEHIEAVEELITPTIVLYEVFKKIKRDADARAASTAVAHMQMTRVIPLSSELALSAADISLAQSLPMADAIVYATALSESATVITSDQHFSRLPDVIYIAK